MKLHFNKNAFQFLSLEVVFFLFLYYEEVKSYWTTNRSHLRSEWIHFQPFKYRTRAWLSELYPKPFKEVQATLHGTPLLQSTQITNWYPTHIQRGKRINETMSFLLKSFTLPNQVVHCLIILCTNTHQIFNNSKTSKMRSNRASLEVTRKHLS
jgi:hypothetical protein